MRLPYPLSEFLFFSEKMQKLEAIFFGASRQNFREIRNFRENYKLSLR